jgi:hypothetical protein
MVSVDSSNHSRDTGLPDHRRQSSAGLSQHRGESTGKQPGLFYFDLGSHAMGAAGRFDFTTRYIVSQPRFFSRVDRCTRGTLCDIQTCGRWFDCPARRFAAPQPTPGGSLPTTASHSRRERIFLGLGHRRLGAGVSVGADSVRCGRPSHFRQIHTDETVRRRHVRMALRRPIANGQTKMVQHGRLRKSIQGSPLLPAPAKATFLIATAFTPAAGPDGSYRL